MSSFATIPVVLWFINWLLIPLASGFFVKSLELSLPIHDTASASISDKREQRFGLLRAAVADEDAELIEENPTSWKQVVDELQQETTVASNSSQKGHDYRRIRRIEKFSRLPVWPAWNGVFIWLVGLMLGQNIGAKLENAIGGRVCPNFFEYTETSPIVMLVHHCHTFFAFDPLRYLQRTFFPEGFPAHPHRGFITVTYILHGGFVHRDSQGVKQSYGADTTATARYNGKHTQWLITGKGLQHEEMFDIHGMLSRQELYQIWLNVPASIKFAKPDSILLGGDLETPRVVQANGSQTIVLAGSYQGKKSSAPCITDIDMLHVNMVQRGSSWIYSVPDERYQTVFLYVRQGIVSVQGLLVNTHHTAFFEPVGNIVEILCHEDGADFLFFTAVPIQEPCVASGSMVMNSAAEINQAYQDYERGKFGRPWDFRLSDEEWKRQLR